MEKRNKRLSIVAEILAVASAGLAILAVASPHWATFQNNGGVSGHIGVWKRCTLQIYGRALCDTTSGWAQISGAIAAIGVVSVVLASVVGLLLLLMLRTQERIIIPYKPAIVVRLVLAVLSVLMAILSVGLFATQLSSPSEDIKLGWTFYVQLIVVVLDVLLTVASIFDFKFSRQLGGDPTYYNRDPSGLAAFTFSNPSVVDETDAARGNHSDTASNRSTSSSILSNSSVSAHPNGKNYSRSANNTKNSISKNSSAGRNSPRKGRQGAASPKSGSLNRSNRPGSVRGSSRQRPSSKAPPTVAVTPSSGNPYPSNGKISPPSSVEGNSILNGSIGSIGSSSVCDGSVFSEGSVSSNPLVRSPLKSSLKKSRPRNDPGSPGSIDGGLGFENKGFLESRNGSIKRVRIESQSTDV